MTIPVTRTNNHGPSPYDSDLGTYEWVEKYFPLMLALARQEVPANIGPVDYEDIAQEAFIKLLLIAQKQPIESPKAYIRRVVHTVAIDMARKYKPLQCLAFSMDDDGEIQEGNLIDTSGAGLDDPETILEEKEAVEERMGELVAALSTFHPRQKRAAVCRLRDRVDDLLQLVGALQANGIDSEVQWPDAKPDRQLLNASYSPAKRKIANQMAVDLSLYK